MGMNIEAATLTPVDLLEDMHFFPGDFVTKGNGEYAFWFLQFNNQSDNEAPGCV